MQYDNLYIYYIKGNVTTDRAQLGAAFIGNWQEEDCSFLFFSGPADARVEMLIAASGGRLLLQDRFCMTYEEWTGGGVAAFTAGGFHVLPPWLAAGEKTNHSRILLDPGVVFGSGTHATTRDCINAMEAVFSSADIARTIDIGCGTGLLSLVAARMGSRQVLAVDNNHLAVETARDNIRLNRLEGRVLAIQGCAMDCMAVEADLVVANIHYDVMKNLIGDPGFRQKKGFVLSGLFRSQAGHIVDNLRHLGAVIEHQRDYEGVWFTLAGSWRC